MPLNKINNHESSFYLVSSTRSPEGASSSIESTFGSKEFNNKYGYKKTTPRLWKGDRPLFAENINKDGWQGSGEARQKEKEPSVVERVEREASQWCPTKVEGIVTTREIGVKITAERNGGCDKEPKDKNPK